SGGTPRLRGGEGGGNDPDSGHEQVDRRHSAEGVAGAVRDSPWRGFFWGASPGCCRGGRRREFGARGSPVKLNGSAARRGPSTLLSVIYAATRRFAQTPALR